jgi:hypothetical protein
VSFGYWTGQFTWVSPATDNQERLVTVELHERGPKCQFVLTHERIPREEVPGNMIEAGDTSPTLCGNGGGRGIRTPERVSPLTVFKTAGFNHSPIPPFTILPEFI